MKPTTAKEVLDSIINNNPVTLTREAGVAFFMLLKSKGKNVHGLEDIAHVDCALVSIGTKGKAIIGRPSTVGGDEFYGFAPRKTMILSYEAV